MADLTGHLVKDALKTMLQARAGLAGVTILTAAVALPDEARETITLGAWVTAFDFHAMDSGTGSGLFREDHDLSGLLEVRKGGGDETTVKAVRDRACALMAEVVTGCHVDHKLGGLVLDVHVSTITVAEGIWRPTGRTCTIDFTIVAAATNE